MSIKIRKSPLVLALGLFAAGCAQVVTPVSPQAQLAAIGDGFQVDGHAWVMAVDPVPVPNSSTSMSGRKYSRVTCNFLW